jgi:hypothetical protein
MAGVRHEAAARPAGCFVELQDADVFADAVSEQRIDLDEVAPGAQAAVAQQVARVVEGEEILPGGDRRAGL